MKPVNIEILQNEIKKIKQDKLKAVKNKDFELAAILRDKEKILIAKIGKVEARNK